MEAQKNSALSAGTDWALNPDRLGIGGERQDDYTHSHKISQAQQTAQQGAHTHVLRRLVKTILVNLALWGLLPISWADFLIRGVTHD